MKSATSHLTMCIMIMALCHCIFAIEKPPKEEDLEPNDAITCKLAGNKNPKLDCWPMCVCQKFAWTLEFQPHLRQVIKTTKICENWVEKEIMDSKCMVVCASIAHAVYGAQGTDPNVCQHAAHEIEMVAGGKGEKLDYNFKQKSVTLLRSNNKNLGQGRENRKWASLLGKAKWMPKSKPDEKYLVRENK